MIGWKNKCLRSKDSDELVAQNETPLHEKLIKWLVETHILSV